MLEIVLTGGGEYLKKKGKYTEKSEKIAPTSAF